jgi:predicted metalloendopeptidase
MNPNPRWRHVGSAILSAVALAAASTPVSGQKALPPLKVIDPAYMNRNAKACVDFFDFANGGWFAHDTIPPAYSSSGVGRDMATATSSRFVRARRRDVEALFAPAQNTTRKLGTFYATCMTRRRPSVTGSRP